MKFLELTFDEPAANLACDEALLEAVEGGSASDECLRIWQARKYFAVLGHSNPLQSNVNVAVCRDRGIPILRRTSGGGTVVQGPGCLNYSLILRNDARRLNNIAATFRYVLERHRAMVEKICGLCVCLEGSSDLTTAGQKFSGNAQYRKARSVLVHGTFLLNFDLAMIEALLPIPVKQPDYRRNRPHLQFVTNLQVDPAQLRDKLKAGWGCARDVADVPFDRIAQLVRDRYGNTGWVEKFLSRKVDGDGKSRTSDAADMSREDRAENFGEHSGFYLGTDRGGDQTLRIREKPFVGTPKPGVIIKARPG